jgi:pimeloyl-ACP methyl ester carboxylesterase
MDADLVFIHGFWSSPATWDRLRARLQGDTDLAGLRIHAFGYESPKMRLPGSPTRIPDYNDIAQSLPAYLAANVRGGAGVAVVTHSQGGLILQRYLAWMLGKGRGQELATIRLIVMLACPNEGSEYLSSIRAVAGLGRHPQAGQLDVLAREVGEARQVVLRQVIKAPRVDERHCPIPVYVYSGRTDNVVLRKTAQSVFPNAEVLPGNHFSILDPDAPGHLTFDVLKRLLLETFTTADNKTGLAIAPTGDDGREGIAPPSIVDDDTDPRGKRVLNEPGPRPSQAAIAAAESSPGDADPIGVAISVPSALARDILGRLGQVGGDLRQAVDMLTAEIQQVSNAILSRGRSAAALSQIDRARKALAAVRAATYEATPHISVGEVGRICENLERYLDRLAQSGSSPAQARDALDELLRELERLQDVINQ